MTYSTPSPPNQDELAAQLAALQAENERLRKQVETSPDAATGGRARSIISMVLAVFGIVVLVAGVHAAWLQTTIVDEDRFVDTFAPLVKQEAVATALAEQLADDLIVSGGVAEEIEARLPSNLVFLAVPVTEGISALTVTTAESLITSDVFSGIWQFALRASHATASAALSTGGKVSLDLNEAAGEVVAALEERGVTVLSGQDLELPEIVLFQNDQLEQAAGVLELLDTLGWLVPVIALLLIGAALWVSPHRRRTTAAVGFGTALGILITLVAVRLIRGATVSDLDDETQRAAAEAVWDTTLRFYRQSMWALMLIGLLVGLAAWVLGSSARATRIRAWWQDAIARRQGEDAPTTGAAGFIAAWKRPLQWGTFAIGLVFLLLGPDPSIWSIIIITLIALAIVAVLEVVGGPEPEDEAVVEVAAQSGSD